MLDFAAVSHAMDWGSQGRLQNIAVYDDLLEEMPR